MNQDTFYRALLAEFRSTSEALVRVAQLQQEMIEMLREERAKNTKGGNFEND